MIEQSNSLRVQSQRLSVQQRQAYRTRQGYKWRSITVGRTLRCTSAKGVYYINRTRKTGNWQSEAKPEEEWGRVEVAPIVSEELWSACDQILEEQTKTDRRPGPKPVHLFAGLAHCTCGQRMYVKAKSPKYVCEKCRNKIPIIDLEAIIHEELQGFFLSPERIAAHLEDANRGIADKEALLDSHRREIEKIRDEISPTKSHSKGLASFTNQPRNA
jgi:site-specific DNA recombinase